LIELGKKVKKKSDKRISKTLRRERLSSYLEKMGYMAGSTDFTDFTHDADDACETGPGLEKFIKATREYYEGPADFYEKR
jgi:hypothetical protein